MARTPTNKPQNENTSATLHERVKELACLYGVLQLIVENSSDLEKIGQGVVELLPVSFQYPQNTCARLWMNGKVYSTENFHESDLLLNGEITASQKTIGNIEVHYLGKIDGSAISPFLNEERTLIDAVAQHLGRACERNELENQVQERMKELTCLYNVSRAIDNRGENLDGIYQDVVEILPGSWQYPEIAFGRIKFGDREFSSNNFQESDLFLEAKILERDEQVGSVEVHYLQQKTDKNKYSFLAEERLLIDAIAERLGKAAARISTQQQLKIERISLNNMNITLREVLAKIEDEKGELTRNIQANVDRIILPTLGAIEQDIPTGMAGYTKLLRQNLEEIVSPFTKQMTIFNKSLTPAEIQICHMIRNGFSTKEIANTRNVSPATISVHREHIRTKFGITNQKVNLRSWLLSMSDDQFDGHDIAGETAIP